MNGAEGLPVVEGFRVTREIGRGGFSVVYEATQLGLERQVALKVINATGNEARRFEREARALGTLSGIEFLVQALAVTATDDGRPVLVMPLMADTLARRISTAGRCTPMQVKKWAVQLAGALDEAHGRGVVHRDVKPENVLLSASGDAYLADLGIAALDGMSSSTTTVYSLSPPHAPPERFAGTDSDPIAGDVYSLASTLYAALAGGPPFGTSQTGGALGLMSRVTNEEPLELPGISPAANAALRHGLAKRPEARPVTASSFARELADALESPAANWAEPKLAVVSDWMTVVHTVGPAEAEGVAVPAATRPYRRVDTEDAIEPSASDPPRSALAVVAIAMLVVALVLLGGLLVWLIIDRGSAPASKDLDAALSTTAPGDAEPSASVATTTTSTDVPPTMSPIPTLGTTPPPPPSPVSAVPTPSPVPETLPPNVDSGAIEALFDRYLEAGSSSSGDFFAAQFNFPVRQYYEVVGASEQDVRAKADAYFREVPRRSFVRVSGVDATQAGDLIVGTAQFHFDNTYADGRRLCGTNTLSVGFSEVDGRLGVATLSETAGPKGC